MSLSSFPKNHKCDIKQHNYDKKTKLWDIILGNNYYIKSQNLNL